MTSLPHFDRHFDETLSRPQQKPDKDQEDQTEDLFFDDEGQAQPQEDFDFGPEPRDPNPKIVTPEGEEVPAALSMLIGVGD